MRWDFIPIQKHMASMSAVSWFERNKKGNFSCIIKCLDWDLHLLYQFMSKLKRTLPWKIWQLIYRYSIQQIIQTTPSYVKTELIVGQYVQWNKWHHQHAWWLLLSKRYSQLEIYVEYCLDSQGSGTRGRQGKIHIVYSVTRQKKS